MLHTIVHPSRLSLLYEMCPLAFLIEKAGGSATDGTMAVLDIQIRDTSKKRT